MIDHDKDRELVASICAGEENAMGQLYDLHCKRLMTTAFQLLNNRSDAEDLLHDVFLEVWNTANNYDPARGSVLSWLMIKLRSRALDRRRSRLLRTTQAEVEITDQTQSTSGQWQREADSDAVNQALQQLPEPQRTAVRLSYYQGLTYEEIAAHAGIPVGTVKSRLAMAKDRLSRLLTTTFGTTHES